MQETAHQYIARILSNAEGRDPMGVIETTAERLHTLLNATEPSAWHRRAEPARWSAAEVLAHLADVEIVTGWRIRSILSHDGVSIQAFDQDAWADVFSYADVDPRESLATFTAVRRSLVSLLKRVDPARHAHHGMHAERGKETIEHLIRLYAGHDLNHLKQIEELVLGG
jgi:hypothetical protein